MNKHEKSFITMMLPHCQDMSDSKDVNTDRLMVMQDTFLYTVTGDMFFLNKVESDDLESKHGKFLLFLDTLRQLEHKDDGDFFERLPRPLGMASLWWNALAYMFHKKHPDVFESNQNKQQ
jgi:hypothetical protein